MPYFDDCPDDAARYHDDYVSFWKEAVKHIYAGLKMVSEIGEPKNSVILVDDVKCVKLPIELNDKNDETKGKRHAFSEALDPVKRYFVDYIKQNGSIPTLGDVLSNVKPHPVYGMR
jgi:hypothetical protein